MSQLDAGRGVTARAAMWRLEGRALLIVRARSGYLRIMDVPRARGTSGRRAAPGGRRATTAQARFGGLTGRAAAELERLRPAERRSARRTHRQSVVERIKRLV